jgi:CBS domain containing-hemolysin-like protein
MALLIFYVMLALGVSFLCSIMEAVLLSVTPSYVAAKEQEGNATGQRLRELKDNIDRPLAAILSLNTIAHTVGAAGAGAQAAIVFENVAVGVISGILTLLILVFSEIIPKTLGALYWRQMAPAIAQLLRLIEWPMLPFIWLSRGITRLLSRGQEGASVSREELTALAELGKEEGIFEEEESRILKNLFRFGSLRVKAIMTPRIVVFALPEETTVGEVVREQEEFRYSRIPIFSNNRDDITGYVLKDDLLLQAAQGNDDTPLSELRREMLVVPDTLPLPDLFERLLDRLEHIALVVDEYGGMAGIVTMEDVVETLLGLEIVDEADSVEDMQAMARQQWLRRARRLGIVPEDLEDISQAERDAIIRLGITGGQKPPDSPVPDASATSESSSDGTATPSEATDAREGTA